MNHDTLAIQLAAELVKHVGDHFKAAHYLDMVPEDSRNWQYMETALGAVVELRRLAAIEEEYEALRADAERYRWLAGRCRRTPEHWGGRWSIVIDGPCPKDGPGRETVDAAIDAARRKQG